MALPCGERCSRHLHCERFACSAFSRALQCTRFGASSISLLSPVCGVTLWNWFRSTVVFCTPISHLRNIYQFANHAALAYLHPFWAELIFRLLIYTQRLFYASVYTVGAGGVGVVTGAGVVVFTRTVVCSGIAKQTFGVCSVSGRLGTDGLRGVVFGSAVFRPYC